MSCMDYDNSLIQLEFQSEPLGSRWKAFAATSLRIAYVLINKDAGIKWYDLIIELDIGVGFGRNADIRL